MDNPYKKGEDIMPPDSLDIRILWKLNRFKFQGIHARLGEVWMKKNVIILICLWNIKHILSTDSQWKKYFFFIFLIQNILAMLPLHSLKWARQGNF